MKIKEGEQLPNSEFYYLDSSGAAKKITTAEVFKNHKTIVIGVPGAFTKVCSAKHLPVNDPNVMKAWGESQKVEDKIFMAADPYCEFTKSIGAEIDRHDRGQGMRSARYTMLIDDNVVKKIQAEEDTATCEISAAQNFLKLI